MAALVCGMVGCRASVAVQVRLEIAVHLVFGEADLGRRALFFLLQEWGCRALELLASGGGAAADARRMAAAEGGVESTASHPPPAPPLFHTSPVCSTPADAARRLLLFHTSSPVCHTPVVCFHTPPLCSTPAGVIACVVNSLGMHAMAPTVQEYGAKCLRSICRCTEITAPLSISTRFYL